MMMALPDVEASRCGTAFTYGSKKQSLRQQMHSSCVVVTLKDLGSSAYRGL